jgi:prevent-host-death family protein
MKTAIKRKRPSSTSFKARKQIAAGEFKAKCLSLIDEVNETGQELVITKRGKPTAKLIPFRDGSATRKNMMGSLVGIIDIVGDPDDLIKPVFPLEDYDMLK